MVNNDERIKLSIVIPVYNVEHYLEECVNSVIRQSYKNLEIILVDDGSTDSSGEKCDLFKKIDNRIIVIHKNNGGLSDARNIGLANASGEYVFFVDSDDMLCNLNVIDNIVKVLKIKKYDMIMFNFDMYYESNQKRKSHYLKIDNKENFNDILKQFIKQGDFPVSACSKVIRTELCKNHFFKIGVYSEDIEWFCRICNDIHTAYYIDTPVYLYRQRKQSITTTPNINKIFDVLSFIKIGLTEKNFLPEIKDDILSGLAYEYIQCLSGLITYENDKRFNEFQKMIFDLKPILKYEHNPKTKIAKFLIQVLGMKTAARLFDKRIQRIKKC